MRTYRKKVKWLIERKQSIRSAEPVHGEAVTKGVKAYFKTSISLSRKIWLKVGYGGKAGRTGEAWRQREREISGCGT